MTRPSPSRPSPARRPGAAPRGRLHRLGHHLRDATRNGTLLILALAGFGLWGFLELADEVAEGATAAFDEAVLLALRAPGNPSDLLGPGWVEEMGRDLTALGGIAVLTLLTLAAAGFLALLGEWRSMLFLLVSVGTGQLLSAAAKAVVARPRPDLVPHESIVYSTSFPSGHSMMAAVTYLTLAVLLARTQTRMALRLYLVTLAVLLSLAVGFSRVYLGVHWPTDVLAGLAAGGAWAALCLLVARALARRGGIEEDHLHHD